MDPRAVRERFVVDDSIVSCLLGAGYNTTAQHRYGKWKQSIAMTAESTTQKIAAISTLRGADRLVLGSETFSRTARRERVAVAVTEPVAPA